MLEEQNKQQNTIRDYVYVDGQLIAAIENGIISYITTDHLNAPQIITSQTGQTIWSAKYDPFGKATTTGNIKYNLRADGQYQDDETGLYYNWYRYYSPDLGRYITSDPIGLAGGINTYIYVNGNPINYTDPMGLSPFEAMSILPSFSRRVGNIDVPMGIPGLPIKDAFDDYVMPHSDFLTGLAGFGDTFYFGAPKYTRHLIDYTLKQTNTNICGYDSIYGGAVDETSASYQTGLWIGRGYQRLVSFDSNVNFVRSVALGGRLQYNVMKTKLPDKSIQFNK